MGKVLSQGGFLIGLSVCATVVLIDLVALGSWTDDQPEELTEEQLLELVAEDLAAQEDFYRYTLEPVIFGKLENYPVPAVRTQLVELIGHLRSERIVLGHRSSLSWESDSATAHALRADDGRLVIALEVRPFMEAWPVWQSAGIAEDSLAALLLHEYYHVLRHLGTDLSQGDTLEARRRDESEAWFYTCAAVLQPMLDAGRFPGNQMHGPSATAYNAYYLSGGDPESPIWTAMIAQMYPALESEDASVRGSP